jgi:phospho-N-acetylmuramoyl-pentapeptide-transferase
VIYFHPFFDGIHSITTIPFLKNYEFDFAIFYIPMIIFIITGTSNAVNLTDGLDGLAAGTVSVVVMTLGIIAYLSGNEIAARYLNIIYLKGNGELIVYCGALAGATLGFLWYNSYPAQVFMGDTGSLALGGSVATLCVLVKKELLLPLLGGIFLAEAISVILQRYYFKYTKKKYGEGRRIFKMAPLHHHFEMNGIPEPKLVTRFYLIAIMLAIMTLATFKVR